MAEIVELLKATHFLFFFFFIFCLSIWIKEEFITIFSRKKIAGFSLLKVLLLKTFTEENGFYQKPGKSKVESIIFYGLTVIGGIVPLFFFQLSDEFSLFGIDTSLGLVSSKNSWLLVIFSLILGELVRGFYNLDYIKVSLKVPLLVLLLLTFYESIGSYSIDQFIQYQKSLGDSGFRNLLLLKNPLGFVVFLLLIFNELKNPKEQFTLINHLYLNIYILIFIFGFMGGYILPSVLVEEDVSLSMKTTIFQCIGLSAKYFLGLIFMWVFKFSLIKETRRSLSGI